MYKKITLLSFIAFASINLCTVYGASLTGAALAQSWVKSAHKDFEVLMPGPAQALVMGGTGTRIYKSSSGKCNFIVTVSNPGVQKDAYKRFLQGIEQGLKTRGGVIDSSLPARGKGWTGTVLQAEFADKAKNTTLVAMAEGVPVIYTLAVNLPKMDTDCQRYLNSLVVHPSEALLLPMVRPEDKESESATSESGGAESAKSDGAGGTDTEGSDIRSAAVPADNADDPSAQPFLRSGKNLRLEGVSNYADRGNYADSGYKRRRGVGFIDATSFVYLIPMLLAVLFVLRIIFKRKRG